jgi:hypothetical protein
MELLKAGIILVHSKEFETWYRSERDKGRWPSQHSRLKKGRPSTQTEGLRDAIIVALREGKTSIAALRRRLETCGRTDVQGETNPMCPGRGEPKMLLTGSFGDPPASSSSTKNGGCPGVRY